jgi:UDP-N-acetylmuramate--alanine ligase
VRSDNIEIKTAHELGIPIFERSEAWGYIMSKYKNAICIAGVHGKTSTTSMITHVLLEADLDPTIMLGGTLPILGSGYRIGKGEVIALESCEYYNSFHNFCPTIAVILNVDADHLDFFGDIDALVTSFRKFADLVPKDGHIVCTGDDVNTMLALSPLNRELFTFGFGKTRVRATQNGNSGSDGLPIRVRGVNVDPTGRNPSMDVLLDGKPLCKVKLRVPGAHNLRNALATVATSLTMGIPVDTIVKGLYGYRGVGRRFEFKGTINGADVYDDYAHHPSELKATLNAVSTLGYRRIILAFQPHTFSRTKALFDEFVTELSRPDYTFLAPIYAAREKNDITISSDVRASAVNGASCLGTFGEITNDIINIAREGDIVLTAGAGDIYKVGEMIAAAPG